MITDFQIKNGVLACICDGELHMYNLSEYYGPFAEGSAIWFKNRKNSSALRFDKDNCKDFSEFKDKILKYYIVKYEEKTGKKVASGASARNDEPIMLLTATIKDGKITEFSHTLVKGNEELKGKMKEFDGLKESFGFKYDRDKMNKGKKGKETDKKFPGHRTPPPPPEKKNYDVSTVTISADEYKKLVAESKGLKQCKAANEKLNEDLKDAKTDYHKLITDYDKLSAGYDAYKQRYKKAEAAEAFLEFAYLTLRVKIKQLEEENSKLKEDQGKLDKIKEEVRKLLKDPFEIKVGCDVFEFHSENAIPLYSTFQRLRGNLFC